MNIKTYLYLIIACKITTAAISTIVSDEGQCMFTIITTNLSTIPTDKIHTCDYAEPYITVIMNNSTISNITSSFFNTTIYPWVRIVKATANTWKSIFSFAFSNFRNIMYIDLSENRIKNIGMAFEGLEVLDFLNLSRNQIEAINSETFTISKNKTKLHLLDLSYNLLTDLPDNAFANLYNLGMLYIQGNKISVLKDESFRYFKNLIYLNLCCNKITTLYKMKHLKSLTDLDVSSNKIVHINNNALSGLVSLQALDLSYNKIEILPVNFLASSIYLAEINLSHNKIRNISTFKNFHTCDVII